MITDDNAFRGCIALKFVHLVEGVLQTVAALHLEEWRKDMNEETGAINQILLSADPGGYRDDLFDYDGGEKAQAIRRWVRSVLRKIIHYKVEHQRIVDEKIAPTLQLALPREVVMNNVLPFMYLPSHTFEVLEDENDA